MRLARKWTVAYIAVGMVAGAGSALAAGPPGPPTPAWVLPGGSVDMAKLPETLPVLDSEGNVVGQADPRTFVNDAPDGQTTETP